MTETPAQDEVLLYPEAARLLRVSERTLRRWVTDGTVPHSRLGGSVRFSRAKLLELVENGTLLSADSEAG
jgi:excisionase family DNA binding protein